MKYRFKLENLTCPNCARKIEEKLALNDILKDVNINFAKLTLSFETNQNINIEKDIIKVVQSIEPDVEVKDLNKAKEKDNNVMRDILYLVIGMLFVGIGYVLKNNILQTISLVIAYVILMHKTFILAMKKLKNKTIDESILICISAIGAYLVKKPLEGVMVLFLYDLGKILEKKAINNTRRSIEALMDIRPEYAWVKEENNIIKKDPSEVKIGDVVVIKPGEKIPVDGVILKGKTKLDKSVLTGESKYVNANVNDIVLSGSINISSTVEIKATCEYVNSAVNKILELTENATDRKAKTENFVAKLAKVYVPIVITLAILVGVFMPLVTNVTYDTSIYRALMFLVVSCPCAIAISVPLSYFSGIGKASKSGILIKGSDYLDALRNITVIGMDKTGTITTGKFEIDKINVLNESYTKEDVMYYLTLGESFSNHPIAKAILKDREVKDLDKVEEHEEISGMGIRYVVDKHIVKIGNEKLVETYEKHKVGTTIVYVSLDDIVIGSVELKDRLKENVKEEIAKLKKKGIKTIMFTGDDVEVANDVARKINIDEIYSKLLPEDKYKKIEELIKNKKENEKIAFVGDGINDSPTVALADIGISMGYNGANSTIEASDVVIMTDDISKLNNMIDISKYTNKIIKQNLIFAISMKVVFLTLSLFGFITMALAVFADVGVTLMTILNSIRILNTKKC